MRLPENAVIVPLGNWRSEVRLRSEAVADPPPPLPEPDPDPDDEDDKQPVVRRGPGRPRKQQ